MLDLINSGLVLLAVAAAAGDVLQITKDRQVRGTRFTTALLLTVWPMWDLYYYHALGQTFSMISCILLAGLRAAWLVVALGYELPRA